MVTSFVSFCFDLERAYKRLLQVTADIALIGLSFFLAMLLRMEDLSFVSDPRAWYALAASLPITLFVFVRLGFYRAVIRYIGGKALRMILAGVLVSALMLMAIARAFDLPVPASVPFIYALISLVTVGGVRFALRALYQHNQSRQKERVVIYGAGASGRQLVSSLAQGPDYVPVAFVDDAPELHGAQIAGLKVCPPSSMRQLVADFGVRVVLLAMPSATPGERAAILQRLEPLPVHVRTVPSMVDMVSGRARVEELREVAIEDLLGRDTVPARPELLSANTRGKVVLVTGGGGSIGSELCRQILRQRPKRLVLLDVSEFALYAINDELEAIVRRERLDVTVTPLLGSVQNDGRVRSILGRFAVETIYHAAAYKHVSLVEQNVVEGIRNNVFGTLTLAEAAIDAGVRQFILVSSDKAVRPTGVMGASKRMAELICQALARHQIGTGFAMVRFGNVLGSSGSVIPRFRKQIALGGPITVTSPTISRYFMTITEAAHLVIQAGAMARGGDVFVLDMGEPVRIVDLAARMARLSGLRPVIGKAPENLQQGDILIEFNGRKAGEKLYEELLIDRNAIATGHPRIMTATEELLEWTRLEPLLERLFAACRGFDVPGICAILREAPTGYAPRDGITDLIWHEEVRPMEPRPAAAAWTARGELPPRFRVLPGGAGTERPALAEAGETMQRS